MNRLKIFAMIFIILIVSSCSKGIINSKESDDNISNDIEYPTYSISEYNKMDKYEISKTIENIKYNYTYFFYEEMCVNSKEELVFKADTLAKTFYDENKTSEEYMDINIKDNKVTYYYNPEYFEYMMYPKDILIELLNSVENSE